MPDKLIKAVPAQVVGKFTAEVETAHGMPFGETTEFKSTTDTLELFPQRAVIALHWSGTVDTTFNIDLAPDEALKLAKHLMSMCAAYTDDVDACCICDELFPVEELSTAESFISGKVVTCAGCIDSRSM